MPIKPYPGFNGILNAANRLLPGAMKWEGHAYRTVGPKYSRPADVVSGLGAVKAGGRWNPLGGFAAVYLSTTPETATAETFANNRHFNIPLFRALPRVMVAVEVRLGRLLDATDARVRRSLRLSLTTLFATDWRAEQDAGCEAVTQAVGRAAFEAGFHGLLVPSHADRKAKGINLVAFPGNFDPGCRLAVLDPDALDDLRRP